MQKKTPAWNKYWRYNTALEGRKKRVRVHKKTNKETMCSMFVAHSTIAINSSNCRPFP